MLVYWMVLQVFGGLAQSVAERRRRRGFLGPYRRFVAGVVLIKLFAKPNHVVAHSAHHFQPRQGRLGLSRSLVS